jgi:hypothetical protein
MKRTGIIILTTIILTSTVLLSLFLSSIGQAVVSNIPLYVNVSSAASMTVSPSALSWTNISTGNNGSDQTITITNTGSTTLTNIYASVNSYVIESTNPVGTNDRTKYSSGSFLVLRNTSGTTYYFVDRMEWNDTTLYSSIVNKNANGVSWGKYYNKTQFWIWELRKDAGNNCSTSGALYVQGTQGSLDLTSATSAAGIANSTNNEWSTWNITTGPLSDYCIGVKWNCQGIMIYRWDFNSSLPSCNNKRYINDTLLVGDSLQMVANVFVPTGIPAGDIGSSNSTLTITAT